MNWTKGNTSWFKSIDCVHLAKLIYHINMVPTSYSGEEEDFNMRYMQARVEGIPTTLKLKDMLVDYQNLYDSSEEVNGFYLGEEIMWLDKSTRLGLVNSFTIQKETGDTESTLWLNGKSYTVNIDLALGFLKDLELYAIECYNITQLHLAEIGQLTNREAILTYDVTTGYPKKISFA